MAAGTGSNGRRFDSGRVCLDLVATAAGAFDGCEQLDSPARLACWLVAAGLVPKGTPSAVVDDSWVLRFRQLRAAVDRLIAVELAGRGADRACRAGRADSENSALELVNELAAGTPPAPRAVRGEGGALVRTLSTAPECAALLAVVARDAVHLLTDPVAREGLRRCEGDGCGRLYLDTSRGRRRRWCSSEVCGNRERVARHRRRAAATAAGG